MVLAISYADTEGGIGLTKAGALNRKFVHWAAERFAWPGYGTEDLFLTNKVLNEHNMPPLWPVHDLLLHLKLLRRYKGTLRPTKLGRSLAARPRDLFDIVAPLYLYGYIHDEVMEERGRAPGNWEVLLNVINLEARNGCTSQRLMQALYGRDEGERYDPDYQDLRLALGIGVLRPLCWLGLLWEDREGLGFFGEGTYHKTPLWAASLELESDTRARIPMA